MGPCPSLLVTLPLIYGQICPFKDHGNQSFMYLDQNFPYWTLDSLRVNQQIFGFWLSIMGFFEAYIFQEFSLVKGLIEVSLAL